MSIVVLFCPVAYQSEKRQNAQEVALRVLAAAPKDVTPLALGFKGEKVHPLVQSLNLPYLAILKKDSKALLGNDRNLPYIKEVLEVGAKVNCEKFGYINSDIILPNEAVSQLREDHNAFIFSRLEVGEISFQDFMKGEVKILKGDNKHQGADGFFFKKDWWERNSFQFPDELVLGATEWDTCYRFIIKKTCSNYIETRVLYHILHQQSWTTKTPDAVNNISIWNSLKNR